MQKFLLLFLLMLPLSLAAQSAAEAKSNHEQAEALLKAQYPDAQKIDLTALNEKQKGQHETCNTCGAKKINFNNAATPQEIELNLAHLKTNEEKLLAHIVDLEESESADPALLAKYKKALASNTQQMRIAESKLATHNKKLQEKNLKKSNK